MIYLISIYTDQKTQASVSCKDEDSASHIKSIFDEIGIDLYRVGWLSYWLQSKKFYRAASMIALFQNP